MSKRNPTILSVLDRTLDDQDRTARLQKLIITTTSCGLSVLVVLGAVLAFSGGYAIHTAGAGIVGLVSWSIWRHRRAHRRGSDSMYPN